ncbi:MAG: NUDIX domain-containing protein [Bacteroidota bacterium]
MKIRPGAIFRKNDQILLLRYEYNGTSIYNIPGGNHDEGETISEALTREMWEELGVKITIGKLLLVAEASKNNTKQEVLHLIFESYIAENQPVINSNECSALELVWMSISDLVNIKLYPNIAGELFKVLRNENGPVYLGKIDQPWY